MFSALLSNRNEMSRMRNHSKSVFACSDLATTGYPVIQKHRAANIRLFECKALASTPYLLDDHQNHSN